MGFYTSVQLKFCIETDAYLVARCCRKAICHVYKLNYFLFSYLNHKHVAQVSQSHKVQSLTPTAPVNFLLIIPRRCFCCARGGRGGGRGGGAYATSQTTVLHMKRLSQTESPLFMILCVLFFQRQSFLTFILLFLSLYVFACMFWWIVFFFYYFG